MKKLPLTIILMSAFVLFSGMFVYLNYYKNETASNNTLDSQQISDNNSLTNNSNDTLLDGQGSVELTEKQLLYLVEEEKLAHDVYTVMYEKYGAKIFGNILESESTHQGRVLTLMDERNFADPRSSEIGIFTNTELQKFYNDLIAQGMQNEREAIKVGIAIEEKDIVDISNQLVATTDQDVIAVLEILRSGSENHLRAFNR